jgi:hypothetical protein
MEYWVLGKWIIGLLAKIPLTGKLIIGKLPLNINHSNIPPFHHSGTKQQPKFKKAYTFNGL